MKALTGTSGSWIAITRREIWQPVHWMCRSRANQLAAAERGLIAQRLALEESRRTLKLLLGRYPARVVSGRNGLPALTNGVAAGLPSELALRRPHVVSAAGNLRASAERADAARRACCNADNVRTQSVVLD